MQTSFDLDEARRIVRAGLRGHSAQVYLFGSWAIGRNRRTSDIDIAILSSEPLPEEILIAIREALEESLVVYPVEVVDLSRVSPPFRDRVLKEGLRQRLSIARKAWTALDQVLREPHSPIVRDASIQRFEFTFEAVRKAAQLYLATVESLESGSPKSAIRACRQVGLLDDDHGRTALRMADDRNLTVHTYNEDLAEEIYHRIVTYAPLIDHWIEAMVKRVPED